MADENAKNNNGKDKQDNKIPEVPPVETNHTLTIGDKTLKYTVNTGMMPMKNAETDEVEANIFFMAYTLDDVEDISKRPLIFVFNGGPGSASVWLHLGALGPKRVKMQDEGWMPAPPYELVPNAHTWLDLADLVFIDPVGTGYSRSTKSDHNKKFWNLEGDLESTSEVIRLYLTQYNRWTSPLFLSGESYGTTRSAGLTQALFNKGIALNGILLISTVLNFQTILFGRGNDLPYQVYIPTYAATAWYHGKLSDDLQKLPLSDLLAEVEAWSENEYAQALAVGDRLDAEARTAIVQKLARYTGLSEQYIERTNLRIHIIRFCAELLRDQNIVVGRLDSRFKTPEKATGVSEFFEFDPSMTAIIPPYTAMMNNYARTELGYETDTSYEVLSLTVNQGWEWDRGSFPDTSDALRQAWERNPFMKVFLARGMYDLATPHFATQYTFNHMDIPPKLHDSIQVADYEAGHMLYLDVKQLAKLKADVAKFMDFALNNDSSE